MRRPAFASAFVHALLIAALGSGEVRAADTVETLYAQHCASCHGENLQGGKAPNLLLGNWQSAGEAKEAADMIAEGEGHKFAGKLSPGQIRALVVLLKERQYEEESKGYALLLESPGGYFESGTERYRLATVAKLPSVPWGLSLAPDGSWLLTLREGQLLMINGSRSTEIKGTPKVAARVQGGLLDVQPHPDAAANGWIYLTYSQPSAEGAMTAVVRGKIKGDRWVEQETVFTVPESLHGDAGHHFGSRLAFAGGYVFFGIGDRGEGEFAQDLSKPNGKIYRLFDDGRTPPDNPFVKTAGALPSIYSYGHRNPQGLAISPEDGSLIESEHGPRGGDEINLIQPGQNYGWPRVTYGINYEGTPMVEATEGADFTPPIHYWVPSIAVSAVHFYQGDNFPTWSGGLLVGSLAKQELRLLKLRRGQIVADQLLLKNQGRIRDIATGPDGLPYLLIEDDKGGGALVRISPVTTAAGGAQP